MADSVTPPPAPAGGPPGRYRVSGASAGRYDGAVNAA